MTSMDELESNELFGLLERVHDRIGNPPGGLTIYTRMLHDRKFPFVIQWRRSYDGVLSDERQLEAEDLLTALKAVIVYEDHADAEDEANMTASERKRNSVNARVAALAEGDSNDREIDGLHAIIDELLDELEGQGEA